MIIVEIAGFLGADAEERFTASGKKVIGLRVATRVRRGGNDETVWWKVSIWGDRYDKMLPYLKKGSPVIVIGEMNSPETYVAKDGSTAVSLTMTAEILKFSPFGRPEQKEGGNEFPAMAHSGAAYGAGEPMGLSANDDLPF